MTAAILLAAGPSSRMGMPKPVLSWGQGTLIEYQARELAAVGAKPVVVVIGHAAGQVRQHVPPEATVVLNKSYRRGRASSLRVGAAALPDNADPILVLGVDQPRPRDLLRALLDAHAEGDGSITVPIAEGRRGHPPVLAGTLLPELRNASEKAKGLRGVIAANEAEVREVDLSSLIVLLDINTPAEYQEALVKLKVPSAFFY